MKKSLFLIILFLSNFFTIDFSYGEEDFFMNANFEKAKTQSKISSNKIAKNIKKNKKKWFSFFDNNKNEKNDSNKGYYGTLPNIERDFKYKKQPMPVSPEIEMVKPTEENLKDENLKPAPFEDDLFLDKVIKKEANSQYVNDIQKIKYSLNNLKDCLENKKNIQYYNGCVNSLDLYVKNFQNKYNNKSEALKESYIEVLNTNYYAKLLGNLKYDANYYSRLIPTDKGKYSDENIDFEEQKLLNRINKTIFLLNNEM